MKIRVGFGYDVHQLAKGEELWLLTIGDLRFTAYNCWEAKGLNGC